jgi:hypothetical protein
MGSTLVAERGGRANGEEADQVLREVMIFIRPVLSAGCCRLAITEGHMCNVTVRVEDFLFETSYSILSVPWLIQSLLRNCLVLRKGHERKAGFDTGVAGWRHYWTRRLKMLPT